MERYFFSPPGVKKKCRSVLLLQRATNIRKKLTPNPAKKPRCFDNEKKSKLTRKNEFSEEN